MNSIPGQPMFGQSNNNQDQALNAEFQEFLRMKEAARNSQQGQQVEDYQTRQPVTQTDVETKVDKDPFDDMWNSIFGTGSQETQQTNNIQQKQIPVEEQTNSYADEFDYGVMNIATQRGLSDKDVQTYSQMITPEDIVGLLEAKRNLATNNNQRQYEQYQQPVQPVQQQRVVPPASILSNENGFKPSATNVVSANNISRSRY
jgi:hypothetical protein